MLSILYKFRFLFFSILAVLIAGQSAFGLEVSSKRDCVVCHIMWMDDFRTDQETLVKFQPGNVLMKDTQGVVSSEEICYSCHDGYVKDSRHITWKLNRHPVFVKPSKNVSVPPELPLSVKGEIYCGTCHSAHGQGSAPTDNPEGRTAVYREMNIDSGLCEKCHTNKASYKRSNSHPLHTEALALPDKLFNSGSTHASQKNMVICQSCHRIHGAVGNRLLVMDNSNSELCMTCHEDKKGILNTKHDMRVTMPDEINIRNQKPSESGPCSACHTPHNASANKLWAKPVKDGFKTSGLCMACHGKEAGYNIRGVGEHTHPVNILPSEKIKPEGLPLFSENGAKDPKGKVVCFSCHDLHRWDPVSLENRGGKDIEGDVSNSFLRISGLSSGLCLNCHKDKKQIMTSDHNLKVTAPGEKNIQGLTPESSGPCGVCHIPHNAAEKHLWAKKLSGSRDFVTQLCTACHNREGAAKAKLIGSNYHPVDVTLKKFNITTTLPLYDNEGNKTEGGKIVCITCHEPHIWNPDGPVENYMNKNMEGDARNSFLRKTNSPTSDLCETCHKDKVYVDGTDHDLNITGPDEKNLLGQTAKESGQCGVCHLVHNSPNKIKLWARSYGIVSSREDIVNALCNSCHSEGKPGRAKIPAIASHPEKRLINNIMRSSRSRIDFAPIFDMRTGKETQVGNISCPTCHNAHQWNPFDKAKGTGENIEGNATNSFLRNVSYNNICIDCHGLDALFRYKYFHDPEERVEGPPTTIRFLK
jgi:predicted CXXCH cytochrome family protein